MSSESDPRVVLVTGASRRIGRAIATRFAIAGYDVAIHYRSRIAEADETAAEIRLLGREAHVFGADLSVPADVGALCAAVLDRFGGVDVLVNNASAFHPTDLLDTDAERLAAEADLFHAVHVRAPLLLVRALAPGMVERGRGAVVNLVDVDLRRPRFAPYVASKAGLAAITRSLARELAPEVRVNAVAPGAILPPAGADSAAAARLIEPIPMRRMGTPAEIADTVLFLADGPRFLTGQIVAVDGGA